MNKLGLKNCWQIIRSLKSNCTQDPNISNFSSKESAISFQGVDTGKKVYELLSHIQKNI